MTPEITEELACHHFAKMVSKMILNPMQPKVDKHLRPNQNVFRPGRSTTSHIVTLRRLIEGVKSHNRKTIIFYGDFKKAFNLVHRGMMIKILEAYNISPRILRVISKHYENTRANVIIPNGETEYFEVKTGELQGDTLAPYLFAIVLDYVMCKTYMGREEELGFRLHRQRSR